MNWFPIALACALFAACADATSKKIMEENDEWITGTGVLIVASLLLVPVVVTLDFGPVSWDLVTLLAVALPLEVLGFYLFLSAIRMAPLSLTVPLLAFTPVLTIGTSAVLLGERISTVGTIGILLVTAGAYLLNGDLISRNLLAPITAIFSNPGSRRMLMTACIWAFTSTLGKKGILIYGALPFGMILLYGIVVLFAAISAVRAGKGLVTVSFSRKNLALLLLAGFFLAGMHVTHFVSLSMAPVAYMISVKRLSMLFGVILGRVVFHEANIRYRLVGASIMVSGVFLIYL
ncbi:EamA family transporter [Thermodesulfobacteriota bacterium]